MTGIFGLEKWLIASIFFASLWFVSIILLELKNRQINKLEEQLFLNKRFE